MKFIFFDVDDTILDHRSAERSALQDTREQAPFLRDIPIQKLWDTYHQVNASLWQDYGSGKINREFLQHQRFERTLSRLGVDIRHTNEFGEIYMDYYVRHWSWVPGAQEVLRELSGKFRIGFLTNGFAELQRLKSRQFQLDEFSNVYIVSEEVGFMKPSPEIFAHATRAAGCAPDEILYVGDSFHSDIAGGNAYGWHTAWFTSEANPVMATAATLVFDDFAKLPGLLDEMFSSAEA